MLVFQLFRTQWPGKEIVSVYDRKLLKTRFQLLRT